MLLWCGGLFIGALVTAIIFVCYRSEGAGKGNLVAILDAQCTSFKARAETAEGDKAALENALADANNRRVSLEKALDIAKRERDLERAARVATEAECENERKQKQELEARLGRVIERANRILEYLDGLTK